MATNPYYANFVPAGNQQAAGTQVYGASAATLAGHSAGHTSYDTATAYPNTAAFAGKPDGGPPGASHYQGYEAALFNAAQAYLQQQSPKGPPPGPIHPGLAMQGKGGKKTRFFNQRWASPSTQQLHYCEVCKISCASPQTYKDHLEGQKHKKKEAAVRTGMPLVPTPRTGAALHCELCNVTCTSSDAYAAHIRGTKHQKVVKLHTKLGKPIPPAEPQLIHSTKTTASGTAASGNTSAPQASSATAATPTAAPAAAVTTGAAESAAPAAAAAAAAAKPPAVKAPTPTDAPMTAAVATETALSVVAQWEEEKVIQPVGQDYVEELRGPDSKVNGFNCRLCDCRFNDVNAKDMHLKGRRHRLMYKKKVDPLLIVESKGWPAQRRHPKGSAAAAAAWLERKKSGEAYAEEMPPGGPGSVVEDGLQRGAFGGWVSGGASVRGLRHAGPSMGLPPPPQYYPSGPMPMGMPNPALRKPESNDDRHVIAKHSEIYPSDEELESIQNLVSYVERALKLVSDELASCDEDQATTAAAEPSANAAPTETVADTPTAAAPEQQEQQQEQKEQQQPQQLQPQQQQPQEQQQSKQQQQPQQQQRMLKGVMRVGLLAKGLLLKGDRIVQLVVLCSQPPTYQLLDTVAKVLPAHLTAVAPSVTFSVEPHPDAAQVDVKANNGHGLAGEVLVQVVLTSPVVREEQLALANGAAVAATTDPSSMKDRLSTEHCLHALAQLRRAKWFQARANSLQHCVMVIRVVRDFCLRSPIWTNMDFWAMELLVERAIFSAGVPLSPGDAFRRVFETLAAGILLTSADGWSPGIADPCEKDVVDACGNLTMQEREDITWASQEALRLIAFRQIFKLLGMAKPLPLAARFRPAQGGVGSSGPVGSSASSAAAAAAAAPAVSIASTTGPSPAKKRPRQNSQGEVAGGADAEVHAADLKKEKIEDEHQSV